MFLPIDLFVVISIHVWAEHKFLQQEYLRQYLPHHTGGKYFTEKALSTPAGGIY